MRRWVATAGIAALCIAPLSADVTITQTTTAEGGMAATMQGATPTMVMRIKGLKMRTDVEVTGQSTIMIFDVATKETTILNPATKIAQIISADTAAAALPDTVPTVDASFKATGQSRTIEGAQCEEHTFTMKMAVSELGAPGQMPAEAAAMLKDVQLLVTGNVWVATSGPGTADYVALQKALMASNMGGALIGAGPQRGGFEKMLAAAASAPGLPYLSEINTSFSGTGPMVQMMQQMGAMKITQKVTSVSIDAIPDAMFTVPADYQVEKK